MAEGSVTVKTNLRSSSKSRSQHLHPLINLSCEVAECIRTAIGWLWIAFWWCGNKCPVTNNWLCVEHIKHLNGTTLINFHNNPMDLHHYISFHLWNEASEQSRKVMQLLHSFVTEIFWFIFLPEFYCVQSFTEIKAWTFGQTPIGRSHQIRGAKPHEERVLNMESKRYHTNLSAPGLTSNDQVLGSQHYSKGKRSPDYL